MDAIAEAGVNKVIVTSSVSSLFDLDYLWTDRIFGEKGQQVSTNFMPVGLLHRLISFFIIL